MTRLWHWALVEFLPERELLKTWKLIGKIAKKQKVVDEYMIDYAYKYPEEDLYQYALLVGKELRRRQLLTSERIVDDLLEYCKTTYTPNEKYCPFSKHHTTKYFIQCYYALQELHDRHQPGYDNITYQRLSIAMMMFTKIAEETVKEHNLKDDVPKDNASNNVN